ncbi:MAG: prolipoprotein diacylglyceryl transferase [Bacillota bacterium]
MINPVAFRIGPVAVHWYAIIIGLGVAAGYLVARKVGRHYGFASSDLGDFLLWAMPAALIGARLWYVLFNLDYYLSHPGKIPAIWEGGLAIHGGFFAAVLVAYFWTRARKLDFFRFADIASPALILGQAIGRWANYVNQEAYGTPTDLPWAMFIAGQYRHPTFLYESLWNLLIFIGLYYYVLTRPKPGRVFALYMVGYSVGRFFIEGFRTDSLMLGPFRVAQLVSLVLIGVGLILFYLTGRREVSGRVETED